MFVKSGDSELSDFLNVVRNLIQAGEVRISEHGYDELVHQYQNT